MTRIIFILFMLVFALKSQGQEDAKRNLNFIIMIDGNIPFQGDINLQFVIENKKLDTIRINYIPGDIVLEESEFNKIISMDAKSVSLEIHYSKMYKREIKSYQYKIDFKQTWLKNSFTLLRIYNLGNKKNKKILFPIKGEHFTYEIDSPNGSSLRVKE